MCGRTACALSPAQICTACQYRGFDGQLRTPQWKDSRVSGVKFEPSYNLAPTDFAPVLRNCAAADEGPSPSGNCEQRVVTPMKWGLVPGSWKKADNEFPWKMINSRSDALMEKATYKRAMQEGRRCVILVDGFYEWRKTGRTSEAYFVYFAENCAVQWRKPELDCVNEKGEWTGRRLLTMAGLFDTSSTGQQSFSVITVNSSPSLSFLHDRMPAVLDGEECIRKWLDPLTSTSEALELLIPIDCLRFHRVGSDVNNARNKTPACVSPTSGVLKSPGKSSASQSSITDFFTKKSEESGHSDAKRLHT